MRQVAGRARDLALGYIQVLFDPWVALGVVLLIVWLLSQMTLLSWADLSYVLPVTSVGYVLTALPAGCSSASRSRRPLDRRHADHGGRGAGGTYAA